MFSKPSRSGVIPWGHQMRTSPVLAGVLVLHPNQAGALPHVAEGVEGPSRPREAELALELPSDQVPGAVQDRSTGLVGALDPDEHSVLPRPVGVAEDLRVTEVGRVTLRVGGDERVAGPLGEGGQVVAGDQALAGGALVGDWVLEVAGVEELIGGLGGGKVQLAAFQDDRVAGVGAGAVVEGVRDDGRLMVVPVQQIRRGGVPPVDQLAMRVERTELVEGVIGGSINQEPVGVIESSYRRNDVETRIVRVIGRSGSSNRIQGQALKVLSHDRMLAGPLPLTGLDAR